MSEKTKPCLIELETYRYLEHCGPNNDDHIDTEQKRNRFLESLRCNLNAKKG